MADFDLNTGPSLPAKTDYAIGCIGAGFIMRDIHLVAYDERFRAVATLSSQTAPGRRAINVRPGSYTLFLRFYGADGVLMTPAVFVDGEPRLAGCSLGDEGLRHRDFLATIKDKDSLLYRLLQYHAFYAVRRMRWLPRA